MAKASHKLTYAVGNTFTLGKPTQARTGLGKFVVITGTTEDHKQLIVADKADPSKTATVKFANIGSAVDADGTLRSMVTGKAWKAAKRVSKKSIPDSVKSAFNAFSTYQASMGGEVSGGKARRLTALRNKLNAALGEAGLTFEAVSGVLAS